MTVNVTGRACVPQDPGGGKRAAFRQGPRQWEQQEAGVLSASDSDVWSTRLHVVGRRLTRAERFHDQLLPV